MESLYALMQFIRNVNKRQPIPGSKEVQVFCVKFEHHRLERTDFAVVHNRPLIRAGPGMALFSKTWRWWTVRQGIVLEGCH